MTHATTPFHDDTVECLAAIDALARDEEIPASDRALRLAQYAACVAGRWCPEVAFDPVASRLRAVAATLGEGPSRGRWEARVRAAIAQAAELSARRGAAREAA